MPLVAGERRKFLRENGDVLRKESGSFALAAVDREDGSDGVSPLVSCGDPAPAETFALQLRRLSLGELELLGSWNELFHRQDTVWRDLQVTVSQAGGGSRVRRLVRFLQVCGPDDNFLWPGSMPNLENENLLAQRTLRNQHVSAINNRTRCLH